MASSLSLPPPKDVIPTHLQEERDQQQQQSASSSFAPARRNNPNAKNNGGRGVGGKRRQPPPSYEERCRAAAEASKLSAEERSRRKIKLFVPRSLSDFADGGAYPEIHVAQYPRHMGNPHMLAKVAKQSTADGAQNTSSRALVNVEIDKDGDVSYDAIVKGGTNANKIVYSKHSDLVPSKPSEDDIALPTEEEESETTAKTQNALMALLQTKTALDKPSGSAIENAKTSQNIEEKTQFIKYTPRPDAPGYNPSAAQRVIQMVPAKVDPMMPPKHKHVKAPRGPAEDPVPVLHAPPSKKLTKEERDAWNIPACISNWKNTRGYTIPLDKRLAADGRGLREHTINPNFATISESLYVAERQARTEVRMRAQVQKKLAYAEKERREQELRELANQARMERSGTTTSSAAADGNDNTSGTGNRRIDTLNYSDSDSDNDNDDNQKKSPAAPARIETDEDVAAQQRERLRMERKRERERELRMENASVEIKKQKLEQDRDISEKIALGVHTGTGGAGGGHVDSRLYNQSSGMDSGFGPDDEYNAYTKPLWGDRQTGAGAGASIYRPTRGETEYNADEQYDKLVDGATNKFQPQKGFAGAEGGVSQRGAGPRTAPVQFETGK